MTTNNVWCPNCSSNDKKVIVLKPPSTGVGCAYGIVICAKCCTVLREGEVAK